MCSSRIFQSLHLDNDDVHQPPLQVKLNSTLHRKCLPEIPFDKGMFPSPRLPREPAPALRSVNPPSSHFPPPGCDQFHTNVTQKTLKNEGKRRFFPGIMMIYVLFCLFSWNV